MRWKTAKYKREQLRTGELRKKSRFLFWPKTIDEETRWLEWVTWYERWRVKPGYQLLEAHEEKWFDYAWADDVAEESLKELACDDS